LTAGASQGTKDRYFLPPDGRIVRSRGEALTRMGELERFNVLVEAAVETWEHETQVGSLLLTRVTDRMNGPFGVSSSVQSVRIVVGVTASCEGGTAGVRWLADVS
jgi:hypothetical protein